MYLVQLLVFETLYQACDSVQLKLYGVLIYHRIKKGKKKNIY